MNARFSMNLFLGVWEKGTLGLIQNEDVDYTRFCIRREARDDLKRVKMMSTDGNL